MSAQIQNCIHEDPQNSLKYGAECALEVWPRQWAQFCFAKHRQSSHQPPASLYHYWTFQSWVAWRRIQFATVAQETQRKQTIWHIQPAHPMELLGCEVSYYTEFHSFWFIRRKMSLLFRDLLGDQAIRFTILRNPVDLFESLYSYVDFQTALKLDLHSYIQRWEIIIANFSVILPLSTVENFSYYSSLNTSKTLYMHRINQYLGLNQQLFDLGLPVGLLYSKDDIQVLTLFVFANTNSAKFGREDDIDMHYIPFPEANISGGSRIQFCSAIWKIWRIYGPIGFQAMLASRYGQEPQGER